MQFNLNGMPRAHGRSITGKVDLSGLKYAIVGACMVFACAMPLLAKAVAGIKVGDRAPEFSLPDQNGNVVSLKDFAGKKSVVLYFYPKDDVGVCKKEACLFRDQYQAFVDAGAEVLGVSSDSVSSHKRFEGKRRLPFKLLSDKGAKVRKLYGVPRSAGGLLSGRVTFVIDREGLVRFSFNSLMNAEKHVDEALKVLKDTESANQSPVSSK